MTDSYPNFIRPPELPRSAAARRMADQPAGGGMFSTMPDHFGPIERPSPFAVVDALLKRPGQVVYELTEGNRTTVAGILLAIVIVCMAAYGLVVGAFSGGNQLWFVPVKLLIGTLLSALMCLPSLYILTCLDGGKQSFSQVGGILLAFIAMIAILLTGFSPIAWLFSQSTKTAGFMGFLHFAFWLTSACVGMRMLQAAFAFLNAARMGTLRVWAVVFTLVAMQMCTTLRPLIGQYKDFQLEGKKFFLQHWYEQLDASGSRANGNVAR